MSTNNKKSITNKKGPTKADLEAEIAELKAQLKQQNQQLLEQQNSQPQTVQSVTPITFTLPSTEVAIVYCSDSLGHAAISNMELNFNRFGEEFLLSRPQFDELVGKYRNWFDEGILAVSYRNVDIAAAKGLKTDREVGLNAQTLQSIGKKTPKEIEELWNATPIAAHRRSIVSFYKRKFIEGDPDFTDREKVDLLNRLTNGGFTREQDELSGRYKIIPTVM